MAINTYATLKAAIAAWDKRTDLSALVADFITLAETKINRRLRVSQMEATLAPTTITNGVIARPAGLVGFKVLTNTDNQKTPVEQKSLEFVLNSRSDNAIPLYYAWEGDNLRFNTDGGTVSGIYYTAIPALSDGNTTNWLLSSSPDLYLKACLAESFYYQMDDQRGTFYETRADQLIDEINTRDQVNRFSGNSLVARVK